MRVFLGLGWFLSAATLAATDAPYARTLDIGGGSKVEVARHFVW